MYERVEEVRRRALQELQAASTAEEVEAGGERADEEGELLLAADEDLVDTEEEAAPLEADLADVELEE